MSRLGNNQSTVYNPFDDPEALFTTEECARMRGCSVSTIRRERRERIGIPFIHINCNTVRYRRRDILEHIGSLRRVETSNPGKEGGGYE